MGFKRTPEGRVFFQGADNSANNNGNNSGNATANDAAPRPVARPVSNPAPQMRTPLTGDKTQSQIITLLKTLNERLKMTQADRDKMALELAKYRTVIEDLEDKSERNERLALDLEHKLDQQSKKAPSVDPQTNAKIKQAEELAKSTIKELEETRRVLAEIQRNQAVQNKALVDKVTKSASGFEALQKRLEETENKQIAIDEKVENTVLQQSKLIRKVDKAIEDRARFMRKIERIEETVIQTRDSLNAKAMVLLTDQGVSPHGLSQKDYAELLGNESVKSLSDKELQEQIEEATRLANIKTTPLGPDADARKYASKANKPPFWKKSSFYATSAAAVVIILSGAAIGGLARNNWELPRFGDAEQNIAVDRYSEVTIDNNDMPQETALIEPPIQAASSIENLDWSIEEALTTPTSDTTEASPVNEAMSEAAEAANDDIGAIDLQNEEQVAALIDANPQKLAAELNKIEPQRQTPVTRDIASLEEAAKKVPTNKVEYAAPVQTTNVANTAQAEIIKKQIKPDAKLPNVIKSIETQAFEGVGEAQHDLAAIYTAGHGGVAQNYERAAYWFEKAAENNIANASYNLGVLNHQGLGMPADIKKAMAHYKKAAELAHPEAQYNLGIAYIEGIGVEYDPIKASNYFENAANNGVMEAAYNLGLIYENGLLGAPQPDNALMWYKTAADKGSPEAKQALEDLAKTLGINLDDVNRIAESARAKNPQVAPLENAASKPALDKKINVSALSANQQMASATSYVTDQGLVAQVQEYLMRTGLYPGPADGMRDALTEDAIRSYQASNGLDANGEVTQSLLSHMLANAN